MTPIRRTGPPGRDGTGPHVAIVGGGASGVLMATQLLSRPGGRFRVTIIEQRNLLGCGLAYSGDDPHHLLNTRVRNMSAFPDDPDHFARWLGSRDPTADPASFVSRTTYGAYLADLLTPWQSGEGASRLACIRQSCRRIDDHGRTLTLHLADGTLTADHVVLATGHVLPEPDPSAILSGAWEPIGDLDPAGRVIIIGTGLSMVDQVLSLLNRGHRGEILAVSRRGLLPREHGPTTPWTMTDRDLPSGAPVSESFRRVRILAGEAAAQGGSWRDVVDGVRPHVSRLWRAMTIGERSRFLRHAASWWDIHRHRMPPESAAIIVAALERGQLRLIRGGFVDARRAEDGRLVARIRPAQGRGAAAVVHEEYLARRIIDCRGIRRDPLRNASPLTADLLAKGMARIDPLRIGLDVSPDCRVIDRTGRPSPRLRAIGPTSRAAFWEITAIPDIREQTARLAGWMEAELVGACACH